MTNILAEKAQRVKDRIDNATRMYHNAHDHWSSEHFAPGVSYLDWIHAAIDDLAAFAYEIEQAARAEGGRAGAEAMREAADAPFAEWLRQFGDVKIDCVPADKYARDAITDIRENVRALPAPAVPAKEA